jgi:hypothetical protein
MLILAALVAMGSSSRALAAPKVRVVTTARLEVRGSVSAEGQLDIHGKLLDDAGSGLRGVEVFVTIARADGAPFALPAPPTGVKAGRPGEPWTVATDTQGAFGFKLSVDPATYVVSARVERTAYASATLESVKVEPGKVTVELKVLAVGAGTAPWEIDLDQERVAFNVQALSQLGEMNGLELVLRDLRDNHRELARATTTAGVAKFDVPTKLFGAPGVGELVVAFDGGPGVGAALQRVFSKRVARARFADVRQAEPTGAVPTDGLAVLGRVSSRDGVGASGLVDAFVGAERVGVGNVENGDFQVVTRFRAERDGIVNLTLRFVPAGEGWRPQEIELPVRVRTPGPWRALLAVGAGVTLVVLVARSRRPPRAPSASSDTERGDEIVRVARRARAPRLIELTIRDRRRRVPIADARVRASRPAATSVEPLGGGATDTNGRLRLSLASPVRAGDQLLVTHRGFLPLAIELPKAAELELAMTRRRDAVLDALLHWARTTFRRLPPHPTPGEVADASAKSLDAHVRVPAQGWATAVERAVFGEEELDEREQRRLENLAGAATDALAAPPPPPPPPPPAIPVDPPFDRDEVQ